MVRGGTRPTYDNDDDFRALPKGAPTYKELGGLEGQRGFARTTKMEYAASDLPWLALPVGPYAGLGEEQGGGLVDDAWFDALERVV